MKLRDRDSFLNTVEKFYGFGLAIIVGLSLADLTTIYIRQYMIPKNPPQIKQKIIPLPTVPSRGQYNTILTRNVFNASGKIPDPLSADGTSSTQLAQDVAPPVPSQLPLTLMGTIVHTNPKKSIATIQVKGKNTVGSYQSQDNIENVATLESVERRKAIIRNLNNNRREYIEIKMDDKIQFGGLTSTALGGIQKKSETEFSISRGEILKQTSDLPNLLQQARAVPYRDPNTGDIIGFRILDIKEGSIFGQLGLQRMDVIKAVNGEPVNSPGKAMELYNALKSSNSVNVTIGRDGKDQSINYNITQ